MKKLFALVLAAAMVLSLTACGGGSSGSGTAGQSVSGTQSDGSKSEAPDGDAGGSGAEDGSAPAEKDNETAKAELLAQAEIVAVKDIAEATEADPEQAKALYCGKVLQVERSIELGDGTVRMQYTKPGSYASLDDVKPVIFLTITLPQEDMDYLLDNYIGQAVTIVGRVDVVVKEGDDPYNYIMSEAYLVGDTQQVTGVLQKSLQGESYYIERDPEQYSMPELMIEFSEEQKAGLTVGEEITVEGKITGFQMFDPVIVG